MTLDLIAAGGVLGGLNGSRQTLGSASDGPRVDGSETEDKTVRSRQRVDVVSRQRHGRRAASCSFSGCRICAHYDQVSNGVQASLDLAKSKRPIAILRK